MNVALKYPLVGTCLLNEFFPGGNLRPDERVFWEKVRKGQPVKTNGKTAPIEGEPVFKLEITPPEGESKLQASSEEPVLNAEVTRDGKSETTEITELASPM